MNSLPDWQLPSGVSRGLWNYLSSRDLARGYDDRLVGTSLLHLDLQFAFDRLPQSGRVIDLGCGTGRFAIPAAQRGYQVTAVDLSEEMLAVAREKAAAGGQTIEFLHANLVELDAFPDASFDAGVCLFSTLGMICGRQERWKAVNHIARILKPGAPLILHVHNAGFHATTSAGRRWLIRDTGRRLIGSPDAGDYEMPPHDGLSGLSLHHFRRNEIVRILRWSGFRLLSELSVGVSQPLRFPWLLGCWRAYGYLIAAEKRGSSAASH